MSGRVRVIAREGAPLRRKESVIPEPGELLLGRDAGGLRHFLDGRPVYCGTVIERAFEDGWIEVRYESRLVGENPPALLYECEDTRYSAIASDRFRWPERGR